MNLYIFAKINDFKCVDVLKTAIFGVFSCFFKSQQATHQHYSPSFILIVTSVSHKCKFQSKTLLLTMIIKPTSLLNTSFHALWFVELKHHNVADILAQSR